MRDPYDILGVARTATQAEIRAAYRKLAKELHPDLNPGKPEAAERFKALASANALLSDPEKRARFDRGEIDGAGAERPPERRFYRDFAEDTQGTKYRPEPGFAADDLEGLFAQAFSRRGGREFRVQGADARYALTVEFLEAANGAVKRISLPGGQTLDVTVPAGIEDGQVLRLKGKGLPGFGDGAPGDALIEVHVAPHRLFRREGNDVVLELPVTIQEAVLGAKIEVPTLKGMVSVTIAPNSGSGTKLRLKGRGIAGGHQYVVLKIVLPPAAEPELAAFLKGWRPSQPFDPRKGMEPEP
jgi:DnaJ-class molecular chaperone